MSAGENTGKRRGRGGGPGRKENLAPEWKKGGPSPNPGGRPKSAGFRQRCREGADELLTKILNGDFSYSTGEGGGGLDVAGLVKAFEALADRGGYLPADRQASMLLKALESTALRDEDRRRVLDELVGAPESPALPAAPPPEPPEPAEK